MIGCSGTSVASPSLQQQSKPLSTMKYNMAFTSPINPPNVYPLLSQSQVWNGLMRKCRRPQDFIDVMSDCNIIQEDAAGMKRIVLFKPGMGPPSNRATEILTFHGQTAVRTLPLDGPDAFLILVLLDAHDDVLFILRSTFS